MTEKLCRNCVYNVLGNFKDLETALELSKCSNEFSYDDDALALKAVMGYVPRDKLTYAHLERKHDYAKRNNKCGIDGQNFQEKLFLVIHLPWYKRFPLQVWRMVRVILFD